MSYKLSRSALMILMTDFALRFHHEREKTPEKSRRLLSSFRLSLSGPHETQGDLQ